MASNDNRLDISDLSYQAIYEKPVHFSWYDRQSKWEMVIPDNFPPDQHWELEPVMNYYYSLPGLRHTAEESQTILLKANLPVVVVIVDDEPVIALSGGGMDLSWQICEAYIRLGFYPPFHFELPRMAGYCNEPVVEACEATAKVVLSDAQRRIKTLQNLRC